MFLKNCFKTKQEAIFTIENVAKKEIASSAEAKTILQKIWHDLGDWRGIRAPHVLTVSFAFITLCSATLIKPSNQIIRSSGFDSTVV